jgi:hypothetical protein
MNADSPVSAFGPTSEHKVKSRITPRRQPIARCAAFVRFAFLSETVGWRQRRLDQTHSNATSWRRFVDFSRLTTVAVRTRHVFEFARKRTAQFAAVAPVRTALFSDDWVSFGIACIYESLMEDTPIEARAFRDRTGAAEWLSVPVDVLTLKG